MPAAKSLAAALLEAQKEAPALQRNAVNPHFGNRYVSLEELMAAILPVLHKHDLLLVQLPTTSLGGEPGLRTRIEYVPTGEWVEDTMPLMLAKRDPQGQGSALTYARRYALMAILGLVADKDDDGNEGAGKAKKTGTSRSRRSSSSSDDW